MDQRLPVIIFAYNRPNHLDSTLKSLSENIEAKNASITIYCDGPRTKSNESDRDKVKAVREIAKIYKRKKVFSEMEIIERDTNLGLANSIIMGVTESIEKNGRVIVLEDDMITHPTFLTYMKNGLEMYKNDKNVASIHGHSFPILQSLPETYFMRGAGWWGWATWERAWSIFEKDGNILLKKLYSEKLDTEFDYNNSWFYTETLREQTEGLNNSWAIRWHASTFMAGMLTLYPGRSLIKNIGFDGSGTHCRNDYGLVGPISTKPIKVERIAISEIPHIRGWISEFLAQANKQRRWPIARRWYRIMRKKINMLLEKKCAL